MVVIGMASLGIFVYSDWLWQANKLVHRYTSEEIAQGRIASFDYYWFMGGFHLGDVFYAFHE